MRNRAPTMGILSPSRDERIPPSPYFNGRASGWRIKERTLVRSIRGSKHLLRHPPAIAFDANAYERLRPWFDDVRVEDRESGLAHLIPATEFDEHSNKLDRGFGLQFYVELDFWMQERIVGHQFKMTM